MQERSIDRNGNDEGIQAWPPRVRAKLEHDGARCRRNFTAAGRDKDLARDKEIEATEMRFGVTLVKLTLSLTLVKLSYHRYEFPAGGRAGPAAFNVQSLGCLAALVARMLFYCRFKEGNPTCVSF
jgi:hypothetical protein